MQHYAPWEKAFKRLTTPFEHFIHAQLTSGIVLIVMTLLALIIANSPLSETYSHFFHTTIDFNVGSWKLSHTLHHWINDGLMAIFFFMIGLEIKREVLTGELSNIKVAILPIISAIGGMAFPALIYTALNASHLDTLNGWGIPMATDIAFAITILTLLGKRVPPALITFLVALAIVDDLGAVLVIAIFYTDQIHMLPLMLAAGSFLIMLAFNRMGIHVILPYFIVGLFLWFFMLESGIHATISGVIAAMAIPSKPKLHPFGFVQSIHKLLDTYGNYTKTQKEHISDDQKAILMNMKDTIDAVSSPATRLEHALHIPVSLVVIPLFAFANAGIVLDVSSLFETLNTPVSLGIITGLILGKVIGIAVVALVAIKLGVAQLPHGSNMTQLFGVAFLGGIGFTMSIFVSDLAFSSSETLILQAKIGILLASLVAGITGYLILRLSGPKVLD